MILIFSLVGKTDSLANLVNSELEKITDWFKANKLY